MLELWCLNEENQQFNPDIEYKHHLDQEFEMYEILCGVFTKKLEKLSTLKEKKKAAQAFDQTLTKATKGTDLLSKIQTKMKEDIESPQNVQASPTPEKKLSFFSNQPLTKQ